MQEKLQLCLRQQLSQRCWGPRPVEASAAPVPPPPNLLAVATQTEPLSVLFLPVWLLLFPQGQLQSLVEVVSWPQGGQRLVIYAELV